MAEISYEKLEQTIKDQSTPFTDRVLACFYLIRKAVSEANLPPPRITAEDVAALMDIAPAELVEGAIVELTAQGLLQERW